jgi:hypothetical protein
VVAALAVPGCFGDPEPPPGVLIENRTDLQIISRARRRGGPCVWEEQLVAETADGTIIARHGPFDERNEDPWIIEAGG